MMADNHNRFQLAESDPARAFLIRGTLWERVAEGSWHNTAVLTGEQLQRIAVVRNHLGTHSGRTNVRGYLVCTGTYAPSRTPRHAHLGGIIQAGKQVK